MEIDWDQPATLTPVHIINLAHSMPPDYQGTLRSCINKVRTWPRDAEPSVFLDKPMEGRSVLGPSEITVLIQKLS